MAEPACSMLAAAEPLAGTAPYARGWVILERPEPWGRDALVDSGLPAAVVEWLSNAQRDHNVRFLAARRSAEDRRRLAAPGPRSVWLAFCDPVHAHTRHTMIDQPEQILDWDLGALSRGELVQVGEPIDQPIEFVCTHSRRDACCAVLGRELIESIAPAHRSHVWECSHLGGHRFAATSLYLPSGRLYGRLTPASQAVRVHSSSTSEPAPHYLRGSCYLPEVLQAAECRVRVDLSLDAGVYLDVAAVAGDAHVEQSGAHLVRVEAADGRWWIVECGATSFTSPASCGAPDTTRTAWQADIVESGV